MLAFLFCAWTCGASGQAAPEGAVSPPASFLCTDSLEEEGVLSAPVSFLIMDWPGDEVVDPNMSAPVSFDYVQEGLSIAAAPVCNPADGATGVGQLRVTLSSATPGAVIRYTLDGTFPGENALVYTRPLELTSSQGIRAIAVSNDYEPSPVTIAHYRVTPSPFSLGASTLSPVVGEAVTLTMQPALPAGEEITKIEYFLLSRKIGERKPEDGDWSLAFTPQVSATHRFRVRVHTNKAMVPYVSRWLDVRPQTVVERFARFSADPLKRHNTIGVRTKPVRNDGSLCPNYLLQVPRMLDESQPSSDPKKRFKPELPEFGDFSYGQPGCKWVVLATGLFDDIEEGEPVVVPQDIVAKPDQPEQLDAHYNEVFGSTSVAYDPDLVAEFQDEMMPGCQLVARPGLLGELSVHFGHRTRLAVYRCDSFQSCLRDVNEKRVAYADLQASVAVVLHGWQPGGSPNPYAEDALAGLMKAVSRDIIESEAKWSVVGYDWSRGACTGNAFKGEHRELNHVEEYKEDGGPLDDRASVAGIKAAEIGYQHGILLASGLMANKPGLKRVHLLAHSAGAWVAYGAVRQLQASGFTGAVQVTLMDPYMPADMPENTPWTSDRLYGNSQPSNPELRTVLGRDHMVLLGKAQSGAIAWQNLFTRDFTGGATSQEFGVAPWTDQEVSFWADYTHIDFGGEHSMPVWWYVDSLVHRYAAGDVTWLDLRSPYYGNNQTESFAMHSLGWAQSLFHKSMPKLRAFPPLFASAGGMILENLLPTGLSLSQNDRADTEYSFHPVGQWTPTARILRDQLWLSGLTKGTYHGVVTARNAEGLRRSWLTCVVSDEVGLIEAGPVLLPLGANFEVPRFDAPVGASLELNSPMSLEGADIRWIFVPRGEGTSQAATPGLYRSQQTVGPIQVGIGPSLSLANLSASQAGVYYAERTEAGVVQQLGALELFVAEPVSIQVQPVAPGLVAEGGSVRLVVSAAGSGPLRYQWQRRGAAAEEWVNLEGATERELVLSDLPPAGDGESYRVLVGNGVGRVPSEAATLGVVWSRMVNVSVRSVSRSQADPLIMGFVTKGGAKPLLMRAWGPMLDGFGVAGALRDPVIALHDDIANGGSVLAENDDWGANDVTWMRATFKQTGAYQFSEAAGKDSALVNSVAGLRTLYAYDRDGGLGVTLLELYDVEPLSGSRLVNVSARNYVGLADEILVLGFSVQGNSSRRLLVRGVAPTLHKAPFLLDGMLRDPLMKLFRIEEGVGTQIGSNDDWASGGVSAMRAAFASTGAFDFPDENSKDAAMIVELPPGLYTVELHSQTGEAGNAMIEIYELR